MIRLQRPFAATVLALLLVAPMPTAWAQEGEAPEVEEEIEEIEDIEEVEIIDEAEYDSDMDDWYSEAYPVFDRVLNIPTARTLTPGTFLFLVAHRTGQGIGTSPFSSMLGFDGGGLKILLGLRYGIIEGLDVGFSRLNGVSEPFDAYEFDARYQFLNQADHGLDLALQAGGTWFAEEDNHALAGFSQVLATYLLAQRVLLGTGLLFHSDSTHAAKTAEDTNVSLAAMLQIEVRITGGLAWSTEATYTIAGYGLDYPSFSTGPRFVTNRHTFAIVISNTQYMNADGIVTSSNRGAPEDWILGFNITREL